jgi:ionotropic glutamate receptor NMDA 1
MLGVFLLVAGGIFAGFFLLAIEIAFKRRKEKQEKDIEVSRSALIHWRDKVEVIYVYLIESLFSRRI